MEIEQNVVIPNTPSLEYLTFPLDFISDVLILLFEDCTAKHLCSRHKYEHERRRCNNELAGNEHHTYLQ